MPSRIISILALALSLLDAGSLRAAPTVALNAPVMLLRGATGQFAKVVPITEPSYSYSWSLSNGTITAGQGTDLVVFDVPTSATQTVLTITVLNGVESASASQTILLNPPGADLSDGTQTMTFGGANRPQCSLLQELRGERMSVTVNHSGSMRCAAVPSSKRRARRLLPKPSAQTSPTTPLQLAKQTLDLTIAVRDVEKMRAFYGCRECGW